MKTRFNPFSAAPDAYKAVIALENYIAKDSGLPHRLIHLIKLRASIINGCAFCVDMHVKEARKDGLSEQWINLVSILGFTDTAESGLQVEFVEGVGLC